MGIARRQIRWNGWGWAAHRDALEAREPVWRWLAQELGMPALLATPARPLEDIVLPAQKLAPAQIADFIAILGPDRVAQDGYERALHARGRSYDDLILLRAGDLSGAPDAVLYPRGEDEVLAILQQAARGKIALVPFGGGTGMSGGVTAGPGMLSVDLSGMDQLLEVDTQSGTAVVEAGIIGPALEKALVAKGLMLGHLPQDFEFSSLGGWIAAPSVGQEAARYGGASDWLVDARLATTRGILETGAQLAATTGLDLKHLVLGSAGVLGIITQARVKVRAITTPLGRAFLFQNFANGTAAIREAIRAEIPHDMLRLSDGEETRILRAFADLGKPRTALQRIRDLWAAARHFDSSAAILIALFPDSASARRFERLAQKHGAMALGEAPATAWREERFQAPYRRDALLDRGVGVETVETAASWSALPALYAAVRTGLDEAMRQNSPYPSARGLVLCHVGHPYADGARMTFTLLFARQLEHEVAQGQAIRRAALDAIAAHGGTVHRLHEGRDDQGSPTRKDAVALAALRGLKAALDPDGIMNPGNAPA